MFRSAVRPLLALGLALAPATSDAALYRWVDELGVTHYATDLDAVPSHARDDALEIVTTPAPAPATRALPVAPARPAKVPAPPPASAPATPPVDAAPPAPTPREAPAPAPAEQESATTPAIEPTAAADPTTATEPSPATESPASTPSAAPVFPGPDATPQLSADDPRAAEVAELEAKIAADREKLRQMISTKRWDSAELASDPNIREIAERLPRMQAQLAALRAETVP